jgi:hypothetical protein
MEEREKVTWYTVASNPGSLFPPPESEPGFEARYTVDMDF